VQLSQPNTLGTVAALLRTDRKVYSSAQVLPAGVSPGAAAVLERHLFLESQQTAAVAAARAAGYRATLTGDGVQVLGIVPSSPASRVLQVGDTITAVDGSRVATTNDLHDELAGRPAGLTMVLTVEREGRTLRLRTQNARLPEVSGGTGIGVLTDTRNLRAVLPFTIGFRSRPDIGGPSAGLAYALAITDMLDRTNDARGREVAATGTIAPDGSVGAVGGVHEKAIAAQAAGASVMLVPVGELSSADDQELKVLGVRDLAQAVRALTS
jgi:PDZ domain-containing protein